MNPEPSPETRLNGKPGPGKPKLTELERSVREMIREHLAESLAVILEMSEPQIKQALKDNEDVWPIAWKGVARAWLRFGQTGDARAIQYIVDRMLGKPKEHMKIDDNRIPSIVTASQAQRHLKDMEERAQQRAAQLAEYGSYASEN